VVAVRSRRRLVLPALLGRELTALQDTPGHVIVSMSPHILVLGGQRSGKSRFAEDLVTRSGRRPVYIATGAARDDEMTERIALHRARRGPEWTTVEAPLDLAGALAGEAGEGVAVLVDCLTLWLSNLIEAGRDVDRETEALIATLAETVAPVVLVSNEVGSGIIPVNALARRYADALGTLNQRVAAAVGRVVFMAAGQPVVVKPSQIPEISL
jgi:adenosylcobinamide kinase / adenosylcobinamide-phosphate guanylyltransferase